MKLKNKRSGEIKEFVLFDGKNELQGGATLKDLVEEWEDAPEEPKYFYCICTEGSINKYEVERYETETWVKHAKSIGNCFNTREEAEKAVEKLKAWKRLKDKGFSIYSWDYEFDMVDKPSQTIILRASAVDSSNTDLDLLFGGEERN